MFVLSEWIGYLYLAGVVVLLVRLVVQAFSLYRLIVRMPEKEINGVRVKCLNDPSGPFSFFGWIFMNPAAVKEDEISEILTHEMAHVKQHHSVDVLLAEMVSICCWMNPFAWLLKREVRLNLEFLADRKVMEAGFATKSYQYHLLGLAYNHKYGLSNNFNFSHLKQRIIMMNKKKSKRCRAYQICAVRASGLCSTRCRKHLLLAGCITDGGCKRRSCCPGKSGSKRNSRR